MASQLFARLSRIMADAGYDYSKAHKPLSTIVDLVLAAKAIHGTEDELRNLKEEITRDIQHVGRISPFKAEQVKIVMRRELDRCSRVGACT